MKAISPFLSARKAAVLGALAFCLAGGGVARAADCNEDIANLTKKRQGIIDALNHLAKGTKNQLDPAASCPKLQALVASERALLAYLTKNKDWCSFPDEAINNLKAGHVKNAGFNAKACQVASQIKKMKERAAQGEGAGAGPQAQPLPAGPL